MGTIINEWIDGLILATGLGGVWLLLLTLPLAVIQGFLGLFPFATLIMLHVSAMGLTYGFLASWLVGTVAALVVFGVSRYLFADWFDRRWKKRLDKYEKWQRYFDKYGTWTIILLRTIPIMPNNLISFMSSVSSVKLPGYIWSSVIGNLSHIWLFAIISASIVLPDVDIRLLIASYVAFCLILTAVFYFRVYRSPKVRIEPSREELPM